MSLVVYSVLFWIVAVVVSISKELFPEPDIKRTFLKPIPAIAGALFVLIAESIMIPFYLLLMIALIFCALGDIAMEYNIVPGLGLFLFSHIFFSATFLWQSFQTGLTLVPTLLFTAVIVVMVFYAFFYHRYLQTAEEPVPEKLVRAIDVYALAISFTLCTSLLFWLTSGNLFGIVPLIGAVLFVVSDSLIGIREFHHSFRYQEITILITYYLAIFLLSMSVVIYPINLIT